MNVKFSVRGIKEVKQYLSTLVRPMKIMAVRAFVEYILGNKTQGLRHEPPRVRHGKNNPYKWQTAKQRRAFFAYDGFGAGIPTKRTHEISKGWTTNAEESNWTKVKIINEAPGAFFVQDAGQQRGHKKDGWRTVTEIVASRLKGGLQKARQAVNAYLKGKKK